MIKKLLISIFVFGLLVSPYGIKAQESEEGLEPGQIPAEAFYRGEIIEILKEEFQDIGTDQIFNQTVLVRLTSGEEKGKELTIENSGAFPINGGKGVKVGDKVVIYAIEVQGERVYYIADIFRLSSLLFVAILFFVTAGFFGRRKGITSIFGLAFSILIIAKFIVPQIISGSNPVLISLTGALIIAVVSLYLGHGFNKRTSIALVSTLITLGLSALMSYIFVVVSKLYGVGSEEAFYLQFSGIEALDLQGLLLGGIILGALGVLDDITTAQSATVEELKDANPNLSMTELYKRASSVGREHIASLVNTLFLAYAGAALPMFLLFSTSVSQPLWVTLNSEQIGEEVIRAMVGSIALILAVPITTIFAAYVFSRNK